MDPHIALWIVFGVVVTILLTLDLGVLNRKSHEIHVKEALLTSAMWIGVALLFNAGIYFTLGREQAVMFLTGFLLEKSLSVDNLFVFLMLFSYFGVPNIYKHRVLFWGILGALAMRAMFIAAGVALIQRFHWVMYVFGAFLVFTGIKLAFKGGEDPHPENNPALRILRRVFRVGKSYESGYFFSREEGKLVVTPLFVVLVAVETTDVVFALDSIPAVLAISTDPFIVYTSNIFAILGLRALFFALAGIMDMFHHLRYGLAFILAFVGVKMLIADHYKIHTNVALGVLAVAILASILASLHWPEKKEGPAPQTRDGTS